MSRSKWLCDGNRVPWPPEPLTFFIDRCLRTTIIPKALREAGADVELHDDHFRTDCKDLVWLAEVGARHWTILTKDKRILHRGIELQALTNAKATAFILTGRDMTGSEIARAFVAALPRIKNLLKTYNRPLLATVSRSGIVTVKIGERRGGIKIWR